MPGLSEAGLPGVEFSGGLATFSCLGAFAGFDAEQSNTEETHSLYRWEHFTKLRNFMQ